jgi:hypothetical protein
VGSSVGRVYIPTNSPIGVVGGLTFHLVVLRRTVNTVFEMVISALGKCSVRLSVCKKGSGSYNFSYA